ncbi:hypothetical protein RSAG8_13974, partial [Rhizoctonia solani AG-8 WAC10335]
RTSLMAPTSFSRVPPRSACSGRSSSFPRRAGTPSRKSVTSSKARLSPVRLPITSLRSSVCARKTVTKSARASAATVPRPVPVGLMRSLLMSATRGTSRLMSCPLFPRRGAEFRLEYVRYCCGFVSVIVYYLESLYVLE